MSVTWAGILAVLLVLERLATIESALFLLAGDCAAPPASKVAGCVPKSWHRDVGFVMDRRHWTGLEATFLDEKAAMKGR